MGPILLVDDNYDFRLMLRELLERHGYHVISVGTGHQALDTVLQQPISLVIADINLPGMNGFELMRRLRMMGPPRPIICITGHAFLSTPAAEATAKSYGARAILTKPVDMEQLLRAIADALTDDGWRAAGGERDDEEREA